MIIYVNSISINNDDRKFLNQKENRNILKLSSIFKT